LKTRSQSTLRVSGKVVWSANGVLKNGCGEQVNARERGNAAFYQSCVNRAALSRSLGATLLKTKSYGKLFSTEVEN